MTEVERKREKIEFEDASIRSILLLKTHFNI